MIIDFHTHVYSDKVREKALVSLSKKSGLIARHDGSVDDLTRRLDEAGADHAVCLGIAASAKAQKSVNDFIMSIDNPRVTAFGSVHPEAPDALEELERLHEAGIKGIKFHPDYQHFFVDDDKMLPIYEKISSLGMITIFHAGLDIGMFEPIHGTPERFSHIVDAFSAPLVAAHWGGNFMRYDVEKYLVGKNLYFDTACSYCRIPPEQARRIIENHGYEKILFASDSPWNPIEVERGFIENLDLPQEQLAAILGGNAARLLGLEG